MLGCGPASPSTSSASGFHAGAQDPLALQGSLLRAQSSAVTPLCPDSWRLSLFCKTQFNDNRVALPPEVRALSKGVS